jgi:FkbM family methyltransferase
MRVQHFFSPKRLSRCRELFDRPLVAHLRIAASGRRPLQLRLRDGETLSVESARLARPMFDWLLERAEDPFPMQLDDGLVVFNYQGRPMALRPVYSDFVIFQEVFVEDVYGLDVLEKPMGTVVDLGANVGLFAGRAAQNAERVVCVEPMAENLAVAEQLLDRAGVADRVALRRYAVTERSGETVRIYLSTHNAGGNSIRRQHAAAWGVDGYEDVPTISLDDLFEREGIERCSLLKCDVEGAEYQVFEAAGDETLRRIDRLVMEAHLTGDDWDTKQLARLVARLEDTGFDVEHEPTTKSWGRAKEAVMVWAKRPCPSAPVCPTAE